ncbi:MAG: PA2817 family protein [Halioglobus sp.]
MNDAQYASHCREQLTEFAANMSKRMEHLPEGDSLRELADRFNDLDKGTADLYADGATLVSRLFTTYPDFAPTFPRDLLWFLGGECLHYMPDEEITAYQTLDDMRHAAAEKGEILNLRDARASLLSLQ